MAGNPYLRVMKIKVFEMKLKNNRMKRPQRRAEALDVRAVRSNPLHVLSTCSEHSFFIDGIFCRSMESFLQSLKCEEPVRQRHVCAMDARRAKAAATEAWQAHQTVWWRAEAIDRQGPAFQALLRKAYRAMFEQNEGLRPALASTRNMNLYYTPGGQSSRQTILTDAELCSILTEMRDGPTPADGGPARKRRLFFDMDGVLVDFESGLAQQDEQTLRQYEGRHDEIPGLFGMMKPMPGAIEAVHRLSEHYDCYILSTAPWKNPSAWSDKVVWITKHLDDVFHKRMVITHCKNLCKGDILIDDRGKNGTSEFEGEWIQFGSAAFPDWPAVVAYLLGEQDA